MPLQSPTDMGVNMIASAIVDDEACREASCQEIIRRYFARRCRAQGSGDAVGASQAGEADELAAPGCDDAQSRSCGARKSRTDRKSRRRHRAAGRQSHHRQDIRADGRKAARRCSILSKRLPTSATMWISFPPWSSRPFSI